MYVNKAKRPNDPLVGGGDGLTPNERKLLNQYLEGLRRLNISVNDPDVMRRIMAEVRAGNPLSAANQVPWEDFTSALEPTIATMASQVAISANLALTKLPRAVQYDMKFDLTDPRAIGWAQVRSGLTIKQVNEYSRQAVSKIIQDGLRSKLTMEQVQANIQKVVGLDSRQATALARFYESSIQDGVLKGLSYEEAVVRAEKQGDKYRERLWKQRAERIARTELAEAANQGRFTSWQEADRQGLLPKGTKKRWLTAPDERTCEICGALNGVVVGWDEVFSTGKMMPTAHPNCRCTALIIPAEPSAELPETPSNEYGGYKLKKPSEKTSTKRGQADIVAKNLRDKAKEVEPKTTRDMIDLSRKHGGTMEGLDHRIKTQDSLSSKISVRADKTTLANASGQIHDTVRYTMKFDDRKYVAGVASTVDDLRARGYTVTTRNNWVKGNPYYGVNAQVVTPDGVKMELQFHTDASLALKAQTHPIYEQLRVSRDPVVQTALHADMTALASGIKFPGGDLGLLGDPIPAAVGKSFGLLKFSTEVINE
jgi:SPP1 gp7 family putative phage head morphogenesis protein